MAIFTIDSENNIAARDTVPAEGNNVLAFANEKDLANLAWSGPARGWYGGAQQQEGRGHRDDESGRRAQR